MHPFGFGTHNGPKINRNCRKYQSKKGVNNERLKKRVLGCSLSLSVEKASDFETFWDDFGSPLALFFNAFLGFRFCLDFRAFFVKNVKKAKNENVAFVL